MNAQQASLASAREDLRTEPKIVRGAIIAIAVTFLTVFVVLPLVVVFAQAFSKGVSAYFTALSEQSLKSTGTRMLCSLIIAPSTRGVVQATFPSVDT